MKKVLLYIHTTLLVVWLVQGCKKDKGNYDYAPLPGQVSVTIPETSYIKVLGTDTLKITPNITYSGDSTDLSYQWQRWVVTDSYRGYKTFAIGKNLNYKCGPDSVVAASGLYTLRLAIINKKLTTGNADLTANQSYSSVISLSVVNSLYRGLMVLHGNGTQSDVGLIEYNMFLPAASNTVKTKVTSGFYSYFNQGAKIDGVGKRLLKIGAIQTFGDFVFGTSNIYVFTDKQGLRTDYLTMKNTVLDYKALFSNPATAPAKPDYFARGGNSTNALAMVSEGKVYYGFVVGALYNDFNYFAAPYVALVFRSSNALYSSVGIVAYDNISSAFMYSLYNSTATYIYKFPASTVSGISFNPANTNANLLYMDLRTSLFPIIAVMQDKTTMEKYLVELNPYVKDLSKAVEGRYTMEGLPDLNNIKYYAFSGGVNLNYYGTTNKIYQYLYKSGNTSNLIFTAPLGEEITMMKVLKYQNMTSAANSTSLYQLSNQVMIVGTTDGQGKGKIYVFRINLVSGALTLDRTFDGSESGDANFGKIYDVDLKTQ